MRKPGKSQSRKPQRSPRSWTCPPTPSSTIVRCVAGSNSGAVGLEDVLPDPEDFVDGVQRVDLELVIRVLARDEDLEIVLFVDLRIALRERAPDVGLFDPEAEVQVARRPRAARRACRTRPARRSRYRRRASTCGAACQEGSSSLPSMAIGPGGAVAGVYSRLNHSVRLPVSCRLRSGRPFSPAVASARRLQWLDPAPRDRLIERRHIFLHQTLVLRLHRL